MAPWALAGGALALGVGVWLWLNSGHKTEPPTPPAPPAADSGDRTDILQAQRKQDPDEPPPKKRPGAGAEAKAPGTFLEDFGKEASDPDAEAPALADKELEKKFQGLLDTNERLKALKARVSARQDRMSAQELREAAAERDRLLAQMDSDLPPFEKDLKRARKARPDDAVPAWLTGELLVLIGGEPEEILPHLRRALDRGFARPRVFASLARTQTEANQLDEAFRSAARALDLDGKDRYAWHAYVRAALNTEHYADALARLDRTFAEKLPDWAQDMRRELAVCLARWQAEQKLRGAEQKADNLPRVRLLIEHRRFARDARGAPLTTVESTGKGEVILELFEDQAPAAVANFLTLVEQKAYDGTRFYLAEPAALVAGGDLKSKTGDPRDDGRGNPGYFIPDEFNRPDARSHFRGALSLVNSGPETSGSQFFITLTPNPPMDGHFTVFGRVHKGQEVVERITPGRTNPQVGRFGRIIPGDLLVRAEVLRKRGHAYRVIKLQPK